MVQLMKDTAKGAATEEGLQEAIRNAAWNRRGIPYNPEAAFPAFARKHTVNPEKTIGTPVTLEFDVVWKGVTYRAQGYSGGILYAVVGEWSNIEVLPW